jgi:hypothetical protein
MTKDATNVAALPSTASCWQRSSYLVMSGTEDHRVPSEYRNTSIAASIVEDIQHIQLKEKTV